MELTQPTRSWRVLPATPGLGRRGSYGEVGTLSASIVPPLPDSPHRAVDWAPAPTILKAASTHMWHIPAAPVGPTTSSRVNEVIPCLLDITRCRCAPARRPGLAKSTPEARDTTPSAHGRLLLLSGLEEEGRGSGAGAQGHLLAPEPAAGSGCSDGSQHS